MGASDETEIGVQCIGDPLQGACSRVGRTAFELADIDLAHVATFSLLRLSQAVRAVMGRTAMPSGRS